MDIPISKIESKNFYSTIDDCLLILKRDSENFILS